SGSQDNQVRLWDVAAAKARYILDGHSQPVDSIAYSPDGKVVASGGRDKTVRIWDTATGKCIHVIKDSPASTLTSSPDGRFLGVSAGVQIWDTVKWTKVQTCKGHRGSVEGLVFSPDSKVLYSSSFDQTIRYWDPTTGRELRRIGN